MLTVESAYSFLARLSQAEQDIDWLIDEHVRMRASEIHQVLNRNYFDNLSQENRARWLKAIAAFHTDNLALGDRLSSAFRKATALRNHLAHSPSLAVVLDPENREPFLAVATYGTNRYPDRITELHLDQQRDRLEWISDWTIWIRQDRGYTTVWETTGLRDEPVRHTIRPHPATSHP